LAAELRAGKYVVTMDADLGEYDFKRKSFPVEVEGVHSCNEISIAFVPARPVDALKEPGDPRIGLYEWQAKPLTHWFEVPEDRAQAFKKRQTGFLGGSKLQAKIAFEIRKTQFHRKMAYAPDLEERADYGAGALLEARLLAVRVTSAADKSTIVNWLP
jgi:hypothetical protein